MLEISIIYHRVTVNLRFSNDPFPACLIAKDVPFVLSAQLGGSFHKTIQSAYVKIRFLIVLWRLPCRRQVFFIQHQSSTYYVITNLTVNSLQFRYA